jgi:hypothetical protein
MNKNEFNNILISLGLKRPHIETLLNLVESEISDTHQDWYEEKEGMLRSGVLAARSELYELASMLTKKLAEEGRKEVKNG